MPWQLVPVQVFIVQLLAPGEGVRNEMLFLTYAVGAMEGTALAAAPRTATVDNTEVKCILIMFFGETIVKRVLSWKRRMKEECC